MQPLDLDQLAATNKELLRFAKLQLMRIHTHKDGSVVDIVELRSSKFEEEINRIIENEEKKDIKISVTELKPEVLTNREQQNPSFKYKIEDKKQTSDPVMYTSSNSLSFSCTCGESFSLNIGKNEYTKSDEKSDYTSEEPKVKPQENIYQGQGKIPKKYSNANMY